MDHLGNTSCVCYGAGAEENVGEVHDNNLGHMESTLQTHLRAQAAEPGQYRAGNSKSNRGDGVNIEQPYETQARTYER